MFETSMTLTPACQHPAHNLSPKRSAWCSRWRFPPGRFFSGGKVLSRHPPARNFLRLLRLADVVDDEDVPQVAFHLGGDVGVVLVHVEAVHADPAGFLEGEELRFRPVR